MYPSDGQPTISKNEPDAVKGKSKFSVLNEKHISNIIKLRIDFRDRDHPLGVYVSTLSEHQWILPKTMKTIISVMSFNIGIYVKFFIVVFGLLRRK